jgi:hypothetical protein
MQGSSDMDGLKRRTVKLSGKKEFGTMRSQAGPKLEPAPLRQAFSAWRPAELSPTDQVHMEVLYGLTGLFAAIHDQPEAFVSDPILLRKALGCQHQFADQRRIGLCELKWGCDRFFRHKQDVDRGHWLDIAEGDDLLIFVLYGRGDLPRDDLLKECHIGYRASARPFGRSADRFPATIK